MSKTVQTPELRTNRRNILDKLKNEITCFLSYPYNMRTLLITNMIYSFVLPVVELFVGAYIMRNTNSSILVICFQLAVYTGIPITFLINGYLLRRIKISYLYSFGMLLSSVSMALMMNLKELNLTGIIIAGLIMGLSYGFFWANRDFLALNTTNDGNRNYYYGLESFFYTMTGVIVPYTIGVYIGMSEKLEWFNGHVNTAYKIITLVVFILTMAASIVVFRGNFQNPLKERFLFFKNDPLWNKLLMLSAIKGLAQGFIVTAPAMLVMTLVGNESDLGVLQSCGAILSALLLYILGRVSQPQHRLTIYTIGLILFAVGGIFNAVLYSSLGVMIFLFCLVVGRPLLDIAYFPMQLKVIDILAAKEKRNEFSYILSHEFGLYVGRVFGCGLFIVLALLVSENFALRYALVAIGTLQLLAVFIARDIVRDTNKVSE